MGRTAAWKRLAETHPELVSVFIELGSKLYEMGSEQARSAPELPVLMQALNDAPPEVRQALGHTEAPFDELDVLVTVFALGSELLLAYVRGGRH